MRRPIVWIGSVRTRRLGEVWAAVTEAGLTMVEFGIAQRAFEASVRRQSQELAEGRLAVADRLLEQATCELAEYVEGKRRNFGVPVDWAVLRSDFQRSALREVMRIPYGETRTYGQIAALIGRPQASRAVGRANATNPIPLVIPCHRVVGTDGKLHGYGGAGGLQTKQWLLDLERSGSL